MCLMMPSSIDYPAIWLGISGVGGVVAMAGKEGDGLNSRSFAGASNARPRVPAARLDTSKYGLNGGLRGAV
jgi:hypothetical protein